MDYEELLRLLNEYAAADDVELPDGLLDLAQRFANRADDATERLGDDDLQSLLEGLTALGADDSTSTALVLLAADAADEIRGEQGERAEQAAADEADRQAALARLRGDATGDDEGDESELEGDEPPADADDTDAPGDEAEAPEPAATDTPDEAPADAEPVPVAAAAARPRAAARRALARRTPADARPRETAPSAGFRITLGADIPSVAAGSEAPDLATVDQALVNRARSFANSDAKVKEKVHVATIRRDPLEEDRRLVDSRRRPLAPHDASERVERVIAARLAALRTGGGTQALVAAGGLCAPLTPIYSVEVLGEQGRPVRDEALVSFAAPRGGVVSTAPPTIAATAAASGLWTVADDASATDGDPTKAILRVDCGTERETEIYAVTRRLIIGNMLAMTHGERVDAFSTASMVYQDRLAEQTLLTRMRTLSTVTTPEAAQVSATLDVLDVLTRAAAGIRSRHRVSRSFPFRVILPEILWSVMQTDVSRRMPAGSIQENLAFSEALLNQAFAARNLNVTWSPDLHVQGTQAAGALAEWPDNFDWMVYPEGTFIHLDAGELNVGLYRDHELNDVNDAAVFAETFESVHFLGTESVAGTAVVCPSGAVSGTVDPAELCGANS